MFDARPLPPLTLVLGGARSGKSAFAERLIEPFGPALYLATARVEDAEMSERIRRHMERRDEAWTTVEEPLELATVILQHSMPRMPILVDCLTVWLANLMAVGRSPGDETRRLLEALGEVDGPVVMVSSEVGLGIVPDNPLARGFRDLAGQLHQMVAMAADRVVFVAAGLPLVLKDVTQ